MRDAVLQRLLTPAFLAALGTAALAFGWASADAARADSAQVTVVGPGSGQQTISLEALGGREDVRGRPYVLRSTSGEETRTVTGFSLAAVLESAGADPYGFSYLEVQRPAGGAVVLSRHQALDADAFPEGAPIVYATGAGTGFLRPSTGAGDANASDSFVAPQGLTIALRKGEPLQVRARASRVKARPGQIVRFEAIVERSGSGERLAYSWYFDDGGAATGAAASHSFSRRGSYDVVVGVTTPGDKAGSSAVVTIQVGAPLSGPDRRGGGQRDSGKAPAHGAAADVGGAQSDPAAAAGEEGPGTPAAPTPEAPEVRRSGDDETRRRQPAGDQVSGRLLSAPKTRAFAPEKSAPLPGARSGKLDSDNGGAGVPEAAMGGLAVLVLLGTGALLEGGALGSARWGRWRG